MMKSSRTPSIILQICLALSAAPQAFAGNNLKIGVVFALSGGQSTYGQESLEGLQLAFDELKAKDPALASKISLVTEDEKSNPVDAANAAKKVLSVDKVDIIYGTVASSNTLSMVSPALEAQKPLVTPASTNPEVTKKSDLIFRTCFIDPFQGSVLANFAKEKLGKKKAAILVDFKSDYSKGLAQYFEEAFKAGGGEIVAKESYEAGKKDFKTQLVKIRMKQPEVLLVPGYYQEVGLIMKQAKQMGFNVTMLGGDGWDSPTLYELAGADAVKDHYFSSHFAADDTDATVQTFVKSFSSKFKKAPGAMAALGYDGFLVIADAFKRAGSNDPQALKKALAATAGLRGVTGMISINTSHDAEKDAVVLKTLGDKAVFSAKISPTTGSKKSH